MQEPIRILNLFCVLDRGGAETFVMNVYRNIDRTKIQFDFLVFDGKNGAYENEILSLGGRIYRTPALKISNILAYVKYLDLFFREHQEYTIIHSHMSEMGAIAFMIAKKYEVPFRICHAHSAPNLLTIKTPIRFFFKKLILPLSTHRIACSQIAGKWQYGNKDFILINNAIDTNLFSYNENVRRQLRNELDLNDKYVIGNVARFEKAKNHVFIIDLFKLVINEIPNAVLILVGSGSLENQIKKRVNTLNIEDRVYFFGNRKDIGRILQAFDVFLFPSLFEGLGISVIEAQCCGLPCLCSNGVPSDVNLTGLVDFLSLKDIGKWASRLKELNTKDNRESQVKAIKKMHYDIHDVANELEQYYLKLREN